MALIRIDSSTAWRGVATVSKNNIPVSQSHNLVTLFGLSQLVSILVGNTMAQDWQPFQGPMFMQLGTGTGTPASADTQMWVPAPETTILCTARSYLHTYLQCVATWRPGDLTPDSTWSEVGLFDANQNMWAHTSIGSMIIHKGEALTCQWGIGLAASAGR
jgi:hypothetical protein